MSDWSEKQFLALTAGIVGGVLLIMAGVLIYVYSTYNDLVIEIERTNVDVARLEKEGNLLEEKRQELEDETQEKHFVEARVPEDTNIEELIQQINDHSRSAGLDITTMKRATVKAVRGKSRGPKKYEPITMSLDCEGGYHELGQFINRVEDKMERLVAVSTFSIQGHRQGLEPGQKKLKIKLELVAYKFNKPKRK